VNTARSVTAFLALLAACAPHDGAPPGERAFAQWLAADAERAPTFERF